MSRKILSEYTEKFKHNCWIATKFAESHLYNNGFEFDFYILLDPILNRIENFIRIFGTVFVIVILLLLSTYVAIAYYIGVPYWQERSPTVLVIAFTIGHWLLLNVCWNYYKAYRTSPGFASERHSYTSSVSTTFCRKCNAPRPARAHHCSACGRCILKMDHHCPWLDNCIGLRNHRYFFLFCVYTWLGTIFVMIFGVLVAVDFYFPAWTPFNHSLFYTENLEPLDRTVEVLWWFQLSEAKIRQKCVVFETIVTVLLFIALIFLLRYHVSLISAGETCIEKHINRKNRRFYNRKNLFYNNPYDFGRRENWKQFLNIDSTGWSWLNVLLPSEYIPPSNGFHWSSNGNMRKCIKV